MPRGSVPAVVPAGDRRTAVLGTAARQPGAAALRGVNAAVVGLLLAALYRPRLDDRASRAASRFRVSERSVPLVFMWQTPPWLVVILCALGGAVIAAL